MGRTFQDLFGMDYRPATGVLEQGVPRVIIGIAGYAGSGKDTVRGILEKNHGFKGLAFADPLRKAVAALDPYVTDGGYRYNEAVQEVGYQASKEKYPEIRRLLQVLGTEVGREIFGEDVWVDTARKTWLKWGMPDLAISDLRFRNELFFVHEYGMSVWVERPGVGPVNGHISDNGLKKTECDLILENSGSLIELEDDVEELVRRAGLYDV